MFEGCRIAVVVPAYEEERLIGRTLGRVPTFVDEVVVVDDASTDRTAARIGAAADSDSRIELVQHSENRGVGAAIISGYRAARATGADFAVVVAGDDQMDPADMPALLRPLVDGRADYVKGNRLAHPEARRMPFVRRTGSRVLGRLTGWVGGLGALDDAQCGYTALRLSLLDRLPLESIWPRYGYPNDMLLRLGEAGARIAEVPVRPVYADEVSGFAPHQTVLPIARILARGLARRVDLLPDE